MAVKNSTVWMSKATPPKHKPNHDIHTRPKFQTELPWNGWRGKNVFHSTFSISSHSFSLNTHIGPCMKLFQWVWKKNWNKLRHRSRENDRERERVRGDAELSWRSWLLVIRDGVWIFLSSELYKRHFHTQSFTNQKLQGTHIWYQFVFETSNHKGKCTIFIKSYVTMWSIFNWFNIYVLAIHKKSWIILNIWNGPTYSTIFSIKLLFEIPIAECQDC